MGDVLQRPWTPRTPAQRAYEDADAALTEILDEARKDAETFVRQWLQKMERLQPDHIEPVRSEDSAIQWVEEALLALMKLPKPHEARSDAHEDYNEDDGDE